MATRSIDAEAEREIRTYNAQIYLDVARRNALHLAGQADALGLDAARMAAHMAVAALDDAAQELGVRS